MRRRKQSAMPVVVVLVALAVAVSAVGLIVATGETPEMPKIRMKSLLPVSRITKANYDRIKTGMSKQQVVAILGEDYDAEASFDFGNEDYGASVEVLGWKTGKETGIGVVFSQGKVTAKMQNGVGR